jgi:quercetin dioxygenase-like cupin family protein
VDGQRPQHRIWDQIEPSAEPGMDGRVTFKTLTGANAQLLRVEMGKGVVFPTEGDHRDVDTHPNEQIDVVVSGRVRFTVEGREFLLGPGEALSIPPNAAHSAVALEDTTMFEVFAPSLDLAFVTADEQRTE